MRQLCPNQKTDFLEREVSSAIIFHLAFLQPALMFWAEKDRLERGLGAQREQTAHLSMFFQHRQINNLQIMWHLVSAAIKLIKSRSKGSITKLI